MLRSITVGILVSVLVIGTADAAEIGAGSVHIQVAPAAAGPLQCVLNGLVARGYPVRFARGFGHGSVRGSLHPAGMAMDVNQTSRNRTTPRMPSDEIALASSCGVVSGAVWGGSPDSGHFQVGGWAGSSNYPRYRRHRR